MPKVATKFTADVAVRIGRQSLTLKLPLDLADLSDMTSLETSVLDSAEAKMKASLRMVVVNLASLKKARKAYKKAHS